jgi:hypothetical protein
MPSSPVPTLITETNARLQAIHADDVRISGQIDEVEATLSATLAQTQSLVGLQSYANEALTRLTEQNETIICVLETISRQTCSILNEEHTQTSLQTTLQTAGLQMLQLMRSTYPAAALDLDRYDELQREVRACCPPAQPPPACEYAPCPREHTQTIVAPVDIPK